MYAQYEYCIIIHVMIEYVFCILLFVFCVVQLEIKLFNSFWITFCY